MDLKVLVFLLIVCHEIFGFGFYNSAIGNISYEQIIETYKNNRPIVFRNEENYNCTKTRHLETIFNDCVNKRHDMISLRVCLCTKVFCIELYCDFPKVLINETCVGPVRCRLPPTNRQRERQQ
jgi:hypothetical protein